jgi:hypothetical protein
MCTDSETSRKKKESGPRIPKRTRQGLLSMVVEQTSSRREGEKEETMIEENTDSW